MSKQRLLLRNHPDALGATGLSSHIRCTEEFLHAVKVVVFQRVGSCFAHGRTVCPFASFACAHLRGMETGNLFDGTLPAGGRACPPGGAGERDGRGGRCAAGDPERRRDHDGDPAAPFPTRDPGIGPTLSFLDKIFSGRRAPLPSHVLCCFPLVLALTGLRCLPKGYSGSGAESYGNY